MKAKKNDNSPGGFSEKMAVGETEEDRTMDITLTPEMEAMIREQVASGRYSSPSDILRILGNPVAALFSIDIWTW